MGKIIVNRDALPLIGTVVKAAAIKRTRESLLTLKNSATGQLSSRHAWLTHAYFHNEESEFSVDIGV